MQVTSSIFTGRPPHSHSVDLSEHPSNRAHAMNPSHTIAGHPASLFVLFFTEMWERFSFYGMRTLLVLYLISSMGNGGWGWTRAEATQLYGWYSMAVYLTPILGGYIADRYLGTRRSVMVGGFIIAAGHLCLFVNSSSFFYLGLLLVAIGTGFFKPNISAIVGQIYEPSDESKRDAGYTIFYMGVNAGAFFGMSLCGYIGEKISWHYGFGLAAVFMLLGAVQFWLSQDLFGHIGDVPDGSIRAAAQAPDMVPPAVVRDRLIVVALLSFFTIFFWIAYDQAGTSLTIFAADYTDRNLSGTSALAFKLFNALITLIPAAILTWLLVQLGRSLGASRRVPLSLLVLALLMIWGLALWMIGRELQSTETRVPATWFGVLATFFVVVLAPVFSRLWSARWTPSGPIKFALGLLALSAAFMLVAWSARDIPPGARVAQVSMMYLVGVKLLLTLGELCLSPVGLSYISKLAPARLFGLMFGVWFLNAAVAAKVGGILGAQLDDISQAYSLSAFFLIFSAIPLGAALFLISLNGVLARLMHGVR